MFFRALRFQERGRVVVTVEEVRWDWACVQGGQVDGGRMEHGKLHSERLSLSVIFFVDVEVSEVVKGRPQGPARLHVVYLLC